MILGNDDKTASPVGLDRNIGVTRAVSCTTRTMHTHHLDPLKNSPAPTEF